MAIKFPDSITQNNPNYITVDATNGDVRGLYFVDTIAARDSIGGPDEALDNHRAEGTVVYVAGVPYVYGGSGIADAQWQDANNWTQAGGTDLTSINNILDVDTTTSTTGDVLQWDGTTWVPVPLTSDVIETAITNDASFTVDTFATADYTATTYQYVLVNDTVGARAGQFTVVQNDGEIQFTDFSTDSTGTDTEPTIAAAIVGLDVWIIVGSGAGYTFKATANRL